MKGSRVTRHYLFPWAVSAGTGVALGMLVAGGLAGDPTGSAFWTWMILFWFIGGLIAAVVFLLLGLMRLPVREASGTVLPRTHPAPKPLSPPSDPAPQRRRRAA
ncbi:hypothetical protein [Rhodocaloribacter sp.]